MESGHRLCLPSRLLVLGITIGYAMVSLGFVGYALANAPAPPDAPYDPDRSYQRAVNEDRALVVAGLGAGLIVFLMFLLGVTADELDPRMRAAIVITGGIVLLAFTLLFMSLPYLIVYG